MAFKGVNLGALTLWGVRDRPRRLGLPFSSPRSIPGSAEWVPIPRWQAWGARGLSMWSGVDRGPDTWLRRPFSEAAGPSSQFLGISRMPFSFPRHLERRQGNCRDCIERGNIPKVLGGKAAICCYPCCLLPCAFPVRGGPRPSSCSAGQLPSHPVHSSWATPQGLCDRADGRELG